MTYLLRKLIETKPIHVPCAQRKMRQRLRVGGGNGIVFRYPRDHCRLAAKLRAAKCKGTGCRQLTLIVADKSHQKIDGQDERYERQR